MDTVVMDLGSGALGPYDLGFSVSIYASDGFQLERVLVSVCRGGFVQACHAARTVSLGE